MQSNHPSETVVPGLQSLLDERGMTGAELAKAVGVSRASVSFWLSGQRNPSLTTALLLAAYFGVPVDRLFVLDQNNNPIEEALP